MLSLLVIIYASFISLGLPDALLGSVWPSVYNQLGVPVAWAGGISTIVTGGTILSSFFSDRVILRLGTGRTTANSVILTAAALLGFSLAPSYWTMCLCAIPLGLGAGSVDTALNNFVAQHYSARHMSWLHCFWGFGATGGPIIMSMCLSYFGSWRAGYGAVSALQFLFSALLLLSLPLWRRAKLGTMADGGEQMDTPKVLTLGQRLTTPGAPFAYLTFFCYCGLENTAGLWGSSFLVLSRGLDPIQATGLVSLYYFGITVGRLLSGFVTVRLGNARMIYMGLAVLAGGVLLLLSPLPTQFMALPFFLIGFGCAPIYPSMIHETPRSFGAENARSIIGMQMACAYVGSTLTPPLFGLLGTRLGYGLLPIYLGALIVGLTAAFLCLRRAVTQKH